MLLRVASFVPSCVAGGKVRKRAELIFAIAAASERESNAASHAADACCSNSINFALEVGAEAAQASLGVP